MSAERQNLFVISSPSGGGKSTVIQGLLKHYPRLCYSVSATTRKPRRGEQDGVDYFFITREEFQSRIRAGAFIEWAEVHGFYYGTLKDQVRACRDENRPVLLDLDVQGGLALKAGMPDAILVFLLPPSLAVLESRLRKRGTESEEKIRQRLAVAEKEIELADRYDFQVVNDTVAETVRNIYAIIRSGRGSFNTRRIHGQKIVSGKSH
ncbi:guanylate kinase [bacterium]|nr:guanylate kinase [bacterium]